MMIASKSFSHSLSFGGSSGNISGCINFTKPRTNKPLLYNFFLKPKVSSSSRLYDCVHKTNSQEQKRNQTSDNVNYDRDDLKMPHGGTSHTHQQYDVNRKIDRPIVHLSSAPGMKYQGKRIGSPYPIVPHKISAPRPIISNKISLPPSYATTCNRSDLLENIYIHDDQSIEKMRKAGKLAKHILDKAISFANKQTKVPITTDDIDILVHDAIIAAGAYPSILNYKGFPKSVYTSVNEIICNGIPDSRIMEKGDMLSLDLAIYLDGVHANICSTFIVGELKSEEENYWPKKGIQEIEYTSDDDECYELKERTERAKKLINATKEALDAAIQMCTNGNCISNIGKAIDEVAKFHDFRIVPKVCGHGIGSELQMLPIVKHYKNNDRLTLEPGMILTIEPVLVEGHKSGTLWADEWTYSTVDGGLAAQFKHSILIGEVEPEILTDL